MQEDPLGNSSCPASPDEISRQETQRLTVPDCGQIENVKVLRYIELKSGYVDNGPAWIGYATPSRSGRSLYFNGRALGKLKGNRRRYEAGGNYCDSETGESFWVSGVKKNGKDRHWAGSGKVLIEAAAVSEYLEIIGASALDQSRLEVTHTVVPTDIARLDRLANRSIHEKDPVNDEPSDCRPT